MELYQISDEIQAIMQQLEAAYSLKTDEEGHAIDADGNIIADPEAYRKDLIEAWENTLEGVKAEFDEKAENIAAYIKDLKYDAEKLKREEQALKARREAKENAAKRVQEYLLEEMRKAGKTKIDAPKALISLRNNAESVEIENESGFIKWALKNNDNLLKYREPEISKSSIKAALKSGQKIPFVALKKTQSLIIK